MMNVYSYQTSHKTKIYGFMSFEFKRLIYVDNKYEVDQLDIKYDSSLWENLFVSIKGTGHNKDVIDANIYKPPKDNHNIENINTFKTEIENVIHELDRRNSEILIAGDYNINSLNLDVRQAFSDFFYSMLANSLFPRITLPTRLDKNSCTLIDNIYFKLSPLLLMLLRELYSVGYQTIFHIS